MAKSKSLPAHMRVKTAKMPTMKKFKPVSNKMPISATKLAKSK